MYSVNISTTTIDNLKKISIIDMLKKGRKKWNHMESLMKAREGRKRGWGETTNRKITNMDDII